MRRTTFLLSVLLICSACGEGSPDSDLNQASEKPAGANSFADLSKKLDAFKGQFKLYSTQHFSPENDATPKVEDGFFDVLEIKVISTEEAKGSATADDLMALRDAGEKFTFPNGDPVSYLSLITNNQASNRPIGNDKRGTFSFESRDLKVIKTATGSSELIKYKSSYETIIENNTISLILSIIVTDKKTNKEQVFLGVTTKYQIEKDDLTVTHTTTTSDLYRAQLNKEDPKGQWEKMFPPGVVLKWQNVYKRENN